MRYLALALIMGLTFSALAAVQQPATVEVVNDVERDMLIWVNGDPRIVVGGFERATIPDIPPGPVSLLASGQGIEGVVASERRVLASGETFTWMLYPVVVFGEEKGTGIVVITNDLDETVDVVLGGNVIARLAPGASRTTRRVVAGETMLAARNLEGDRLLEREVVVIPGEIVRWSLER